MSTFTVYFFASQFLNVFFLANRPVGQTVTRSSLEREVRDSNLGPVKSDTVGRHFFEKSCAARAQ